MAEEEKSQSKQGSAAALGGQGWVETLADPLGLLRK